MGQARARGTREERAAEAIERRRQAALGRERAALKLRQMAEHMAAAKGRTVPHSVVAVLPDGSKLVVTDPDPAIRFTPAPII